MLKYNPILDQIVVPSFALEMEENPSAIVQKAEDAYHQKIQQVCDYILQEGRLMIFITGPSASGKTTTSQRIAQELTRRGKHVSSISLDNFYKCAAELPRWKDGYQNYESIEGLDLDHFNKTVSTLLKEGKAQFPIFDFSVNQRASQTIELRFDQDSLLIFEGIHALHPLISQAVEGYPCVKIYISVHSNFVDTSGQILLSARDLRLTRRILRDFTYRDTTADETFEMWEYVMMGEELYIRPYRQYADLHIDSAHLYEPYLYHDEILRALASSNHNSTYGAAIERLHHAYSYFTSISPSLIPQDSLIREFMKPE